MQTSVTIVKAWCLRHPPEKARLFKYGSARCLALPTVWKHGQGIKRLGLLIAFLLIPLSRADLSFNPDFVENQICRRARWARPAGFSVPGLMHHLAEESNFATEVIEYIPGTGIVSDWMTGQPFNDPTAALGRPTVDTTGNGFEIDPTEAVPVVPVSPAFRSFELVTIGNGGSLTLKFEQPVFDHPNHPYGIDFIVFGNALQTGDPNWSNRSPHSVKLRESVFAEPGLVSVSQDGDTWFTYTNGPYADTFAPTLGRIFDPDAPDMTVGDWNEWWGEPTDPAWPLDPQITASNLVGRTVAEVARIYGRSAGGTGFDLSVLDLPVDADTGMKWMQYIRIEAPMTPGITPEIDAVAAVRPVSDYELWKLEHFDWEQRVDPEISGDEAAGLIHGVPNRLVYAMGLDLVDRGLDLDFDPKSGELVFSFPRRVGQDVLQLRAEYSTNLVNWLSVGTESPPSVKSHDDGTEIVTYSITPDSNFGAVRIKGVVP